MKITSNIIGSLRKLNVSKNNLNRYIRNHYPTIYKRIIDQTDFLNKYSKNENMSDISILERFYCIEHNLTERPLCKTCRLKLVSYFNKQKEEYGKWCSPSCQSSDRECVEKSKRSKMQKYGNENYNGVDKSRATRYDKNGGSWHGKEFADSVKQTKLLRYGDENYTNVEKMKNTISDRISKDPNFWKKREEKAENTKMNKGHEAKWNNREKFKKTIGDFSDERKTEISRKRKETNMTRYGYGSTLQVPEFRNVSVDYYMDNFGCSCAQQTEEWKREYSKSMMEKYGVKSYLLTDDSRRKRKNRSIENRYRYLTECEFDIPMFSIDDFGTFEDTKSIIFKFKCKTCGMEFESYVGNHRGIHDRCPNCFKYDCISEEENEFFSFIKDSFDGEVVRNTKKIIPPLELDVYVPSLNLAFEYDGLYWHCDEQKDGSYHLMKTIECEKRGIRLVHVFESEWLNSKDIVKSRILGMLNKFNAKIYGRMCTVDTVDSSTARDFLVRNHIQSSTNAPVNIGLKYKGELVSLMTFSKSRMSAKFEYELVRFCNKLNCTVIGGASKLLKYFERNYRPKSIVTYADRRWSVGGLYHKLGFTLDHVSKPNYWYFKHGRYVLESRMKYQKHKLKSLLPSYDDAKTESENMKMNDYYRIFDCGNYVFIKNYISDSATS